MNRIQDQPQEPNKCQHTGCMCEAATGSDYCGDSCKNTAGDVGQGCQCGHAACGE